MRERASICDVIVWWAHNKECLALTSPPTHSRTLPLTHTLNSAHHQISLHCVTVSGCRIDTGTLSAYKHLITNTQNTPNTQRISPIPPKSLHFFLQTR